MGNKLEPYAIGVELTSGRWSKSLITIPVSRNHQRLHETDEKLQRE